MIIYKPVSKKSKAVQSLRQVSSDQRGVAVEGIRTLLQR
jgi:hypothetical protein